MTKRHSIKIFLAFATFRVLNVFLIQSQFDPDEYWQQLEPAYCHVFMPAPADCAGLTWEWKRRSKLAQTDDFSNFIEASLQGPLRSYVSILPTLLFYHIVKYLDADSPWMVARGPVFLYAILVAAISDYCTWYLAQWVFNAKKYPTTSISIQWGVVYTSLSSWFLAYCLPRTYSNSLETCLLLIALCLVAPELFQENLTHAEKFRIPRSCLAFFIGGICCSIRFTCVAAFVPMGIVLSLSRKSRSILSILNYLLCICAVYGLAGLGVSLILDRYMYGFSTMPLLGNIQFNVIDGNGRLYGTHPFHWYFTAGIPAIAGSMTPFLCWSIFQRKSWTHGERNLWLICFVYVMAHSLSAHKEFRFLLPILPLFSLLSGEKVYLFSQSGKRRTRFLAVAAAVNLVVVAYLGLLHQSASITINRRIVELSKHEPQTYSIHYLMGCHSTPILSHLHSPPITFNPWTLDCSPSCRSDPKKPCESDQFQNDPGSFMEDAYFHCSDFEEGTCITDLRIFYPDFLVTNAGDVPAMQSRIVTMGMKEAGRFFNGILGIRILNFFTLGTKPLSEGAYSTIELFGGLIMLSIDEFVLFVNKGINPRY